MNPTPQYISYAAALKMVNAIAHGLLGLNVRKVGFYAQNCVEFVLLDLACAQTGVVFVPLYDTQPLDEIKLMVDEQQLRVVFTTEKLAGNLAFKQELLLFFLDHSIALEREHERKFSQLIGAELHTEYAENP